MDLGFRLIRSITVVLLLSSCAGGTPGLTPDPLSATAVAVTSTAPPPTATVAPTLTSTPPPPLPGTGGGVIAFVSNRTGNHDLFLMNADGSDQRPLSSAEAQEGWVSWSPDGLRIAFQSDRSGALNVHVVDVVNGVLASEDGMGRLTNSLPGRGSWEPAWSPDGMWIAYSSQQAAGSDIFLVRPDGTARQRLTDNDALDGTPAWSPDGTRLAIFSDRDGSWNLYVMNADGSQERRLTADAAEDSAPAWSPDGNWIAFMSDRDGNPEIYQIPPDGTGLTRLTHHAGEDWFPSWSPDGTRIAFSSNRDGNHEIYLMNSDGGGAQRITDNAAEDWSPVWWPAAG